MRDYKKSAGMSQPSAKLKRALKVGDGMIAIQNPKLVKKLKKKLLIEWGNVKSDFEHNPTGKGGKSKQDIMTVIQATAEHLAGETQSFVERKYKLSADSVSSALRTIFPSQEQREIALENLLLDNAVHGAMIFREKAHNLNARDAALTAGIFTQRYTELKKARANNHAPDMPITMILKLEQTIENAKQIHGKTIDID